MTSTKPNSGDDPLSQQRPIISPYFVAAELLWRRLRWDIVPESWRSRSRLRAMRNQYEGEKAVILCNGPSLLKTDFDALGSVFTFGLNKINLLFEKSAFRPSCVVSVNPYVIEQNADFFRATDIPLFLESRAYAHVGARRGVNYLHSTGVHRFARDVSVSVFEGFTVTYVAMQLAFHLGFRQVALVGCDHSFGAKGPANAVVTSGQEDADHFDPNYFAGGVKWQLPDLVESEISYLRAGKIYAADGRQLINCTEGGHLDVFPRLALAEFLAAPPA